MNRDELIKLAAYLTERLEESEATRKKEREESAGSISALTAQVSALTEELRKSNEAVFTMTGQISELMRQLQAEKEKSAKLQSAVKVGKRNLFGRKSQKGTKAKDKDDDNLPTPHTDVEDAGIPARQS